MGEMTPPTVADYAQDSTDKLARTLNAKIAELERRVKELEKKLNSTAPAKDRKVFRAD